MGISTLKDLAFFNVISTAWKDSGMMKHISIYAFLGNKNGEFSNEADNALSIINKRTELFTKFTISNDNIPKKLKIKLIIVFEELTTELSKWALVIASKLKQLSKDQVTFCVNRIVVNNGYLNKKQTVLKILEDSKFLIKFDYELLSLSYITDEQLKITSENILKEIANKNTVTTPLNESVHVSLIEAEIKKVLSSYSSSSWTSKNERTTTFNNRDTTNLEYVITLNDSEYLKYYCEHVETDLTQEDYYTAAAFAVNFDSCNVDTMVFLYKRCDTKHWVKLLDKYPIELICQVLHSWRHRHLAIEWFRLIKDRINSELLIYLFESVRLNWGHNEYERYDLLPVMVNLFFEAPDHVKFQNEFFYHVLPDRLVIYKEDIEYIYPIIDYCNDEINKRLLAKIMINFVMNNKEDTIPLCLTLLPKLKLNIGTYKSIISHAEIREELLSLWFKSNVNVKPYKNYSEYCQQLEKTLKNSEDIQLFKSELLNDKHFILTYMGRHAHECYDFLKWCHNGNVAETEVYRSVLLAEGILQKVYENIIAMGGNLKVSDELLQVLKLNANVCELIKRETLSKAYIKKIVLSKFLKESNDFSMHRAIQKQWKIFYSDEDDEKAFFRRLFLSDVGRDALIQLMFKYKLEDVCLRMSVTKDLERFSNIKDLLAQYDLIDGVHRMLERHGNPKDVCPERIFPPSLSSDELKIAQEWVNFNYTSFLLILTMDFDLSYFSSLEQLPLGGIVSNLTFRALSEQEGNEMEVQ